MGQAGVVGQEVVEWKWLNVGVLRLLNELDPYSLAPGTEDGAPADEYATEAAPIVSVLTRDGAITTDQVDAIWQKWFGEPLTAVVGSERVDEFVVELISLARSHH